MPSSPQELVTRLKALANAVSELEVRVPVSYEELADSVGTTPQQLQSDLALLAEWTFGESYLDLKLDDDSVTLLRPVPNMTDKVLLSHTQLLATILALETAGLPKTASLMHTLIDALPDDDDDDGYSNELLKRIAVFPSGVTFDIFATLALGLDSQRSLAIEYVDAQGASSKRTIDVVRMSYEREGWYVHGFDRLSQKQRTFRMDRIRSAQVLYFDRVEGRRNYDAPQSVVEALKHAKQEHGYLATVVFASERDFVERDWQLIATKEERADGSLVAQIGVVNEAWFARKLASMGGRAHAEQPAQLIDAVQECVARLRADNA